MDGLVRDLRFAVKIFRKQPLLFAAAVACLGLGIGATTSVFSLVKGVLLEPLAYENAEQVSVLWNRFSNARVPRSPVSGWEYLDLKQETGVFDEVSGLLLWYFNWTDGDPPERLLGARVTSNLFPLLGVEPRIGRTFTAEEEAAGDPVVVLSHDLWRRAFGSDEQILGRTMSLGRRPHTVIGVLPEGFASMPPGAELWVPLVPNPAVPRHMRGVLALTRLRDGLDLASARDHLTTLENRFIQDHPDLYPADGSWGLDLTSLREMMTTRVEGRLLAFLGAVVLVLLIACVNVANLLLALATGREKEMTLRAAFGAGRPRLIRQLFAESLLLALAGGVLGILFAVGGLRFLSRALAGRLPRLDQVGIDLPVLAFCMAAALATGLLFGLAPAFFGSRTDLRGALMAGGRTAAGARRHPLQKALVVLEVALAVAVLIGAGLMLRTVHHLEAVDPGFRTEGLVTAQLFLPATSYRDDASRRGFYERLRPELADVPGIRRSGLISQLPLGTSWQGGRVLAEGGDPQNPGPGLGWRMVSPDLFETLGLRLESGRFFTELDRETTEPVVIIDRATARRLWPDRDPVGQRLKLLAPGRDAWRTVVGVVAPVKHTGFDVESFEQLYLPYSQHPVEELGLVVQSDLDLAGTTSALRSALAAIDPEQPIAEIRTSEQMVESALAGSRLNLTLFLLFGALAAALAAIGIYGVMSYSVSRRRGEIGVRRALGARRLDILRLVLGEGLKTSALGVAAGLVLAMLLTRLLSKILAGLVHGVEAFDPVTFLAVSLGLLLVALLSSLLPAWRATRIDPMEALRED